MSETGDVAPWRQDLLPRPTSPALRDLQAEGTWLIVDEQGYRTHYLCASCGADLTDLRVHLVAVCPYCTAPMDFLLDGAERTEHRYEGWWPYDHLDQRYVQWCPRARSGEWVDNGDGTRTAEMVSCRLFEGHDGDCEFGPGRVRPPLNPAESWGWR